MATSPILHFGGPGQPDRHLRNLLEERIHGVPAGGEIAWTSYYFRDRALADALLAAAGRGVNISLLMQKSPRYRGANDAVIAMLGKHGTIRPKLWQSRAPKKLSAHMHSKIYYFSHPAPSAFVGSFNPSTDRPENPDVIAAIGDQDRGHNLLLETQESAICAALKEYSLRSPTPWQRFAPAQNKAVEDGGSSLWFFPRFNSHIIHTRLRQLGNGSDISIAISHFKDLEILALLGAAAARGGRVRMVVHHTERRVPQSTVELARQQGIDIRRYAHPEALPMHSKYMVIKESGVSECWLGSLNYNRRSFYLNHEMLMRVATPEIGAQLTQNFDSIFAACPSPS